MSRRRTIASMFLLLTAASLTSGLLIATRPSLGGWAAWTGDDLALVCPWWCALLGSLWPAATTLPCVAAAARGPTRAARPSARSAPPLARRALHAALIA